MKTITTIKPLILACAVIGLAAIAIPFSLDSYGRSQRVFGVSGGLDSPQVEKIIVETPADAYAAWKSRGMHGRRIVYVSSQWERLNYIIEPPASRPYPLRLYNLSDLWEQAEHTSANFLFAAVMNGIAREVIVILPKTERESVAARARSAKEYRMDGETLYFPYRDIPRWFVSDSGFTGEKEPALLFVSASYFKQNEPDGLFRALLETGLASDCVILSRAADDPSVTERERGKLARFAYLLNFPPRRQSS